MREIPQDLRNELTAAFLRNFQRVFLWSLALQCAVAIPLFAARKLWSLTVVLLLLVLVIVVPRRLLQRGRVKGAGWVMVVSALLLSAGFTVVSGGIRSPAAFSQLSLMVTAMTILGLRGTLLVGVPLMALDLGLAVYQSSGGTLPLLLPGPPVASWFVFLGAVFVAVSNVHLALAWLGETLGERRRMFERLRELTEHQEDAREAERSRVAQEIHEDLGQQLAAVKLRVVLLSRDLASNKPAAFAQLGTLNQLLDDAIQIMRGIASELRPGVLDIMGLNAALEWLARETRNRLGLLCTTDLETVRVDPHTATVIFRVAQEALTNVTRHAHAQHVWIALRQDGDSAMLTVRDDRQGFRREDIDKPGSFGVAGMRERARSKGGTFEIAPHEDGGTIAKLRLPSAKAVSAGSS